MDDLPPDPLSCEAEPITFLERIQSFGFLLAMADDWTIVRASANLAAHVGIEPLAVIGKTLDSLVDAEVLHGIRNRIFGLKAIGGTERLYDVVLLAGGEALDLALHYAGNLIVLEGERAGRDGRTDAASLVRTMMVRLGKHTELDAFHHDAARQIRALTGFDRVMMYRFDADGAGEVIAEAVAAGAEAFLGLHYPASDIPAQARTLYLRNTFRIIADVHAATVPLLPLSAIPLDLSLAITRAVSPAHIEYLGNMGIAASASISIIVDGALWGLIACHHATPRIPTFVVRTAAELFGQMVSMTLESRLRQVADQLDRQGRVAVTRMVAAIATDEGLLSHAGWLQDVMREMIHSDGVVAHIGGRVTCSGSTPAAAQVELLAARLEHSPPGEVFATDNLAALGLGAAAPDAPAGVLGIPISRAPGDYIFLFRREYLQEITWAGEPVKVAAAADGSHRLSPRKSFAAFAESVRGRSQAFTEAERRTAEAVRSGLVEVFLRGSHHSEVEQERTKQSQELLIAELNHRVRNVLALIRGLITQTQGEGGDAASYVKSLNGRVQALARAHDRVTHQNWGPGPLNAIFEDEIEAYVPTCRERFTITGPRVLLHPQAFSTLALIVHELVTNSSKYGSLSDSGRVEVALRMVAGEGLYIAWRERGGPRVRPPTRRGFGSVIIERVVPFDLQGTTALRYLPTGLEADFFIPERYVAAVDVADPGPRAGAAVAAARALLATARPLEGRRVLLLEDNLIVALESEVLLRSLGATEVFAASTVAAATHILEAESPDFAVLDINLGFETSLDFALRVQSAAIPYIFASGYGENSLISTLHAAAVTVSKPYDRENLGLAIVTALAAHDGPPPQASSP